MEENEKFEEISKAFLSNALDLDLAEKRIEQMEEEIENRKMLSELLLSMNRRDRREFIRNFEKRMKKDLNKKNEKKEKVD